jgi:hypothetical protein
MISQSPQPDFKIESVSIFPRCLLYSPAMRSSARIANRQGAPPPVRTLAWLGFASLRFASLSSGFPCSVLSLFLPLHVLQAFWHSVWYGDTTEVRTCVLVWYLWTLVFAVWLGVAAVAAVPGVDFSAHLEAESRSLDVHRGSILYAYVRFSVCGPVTGIQQTSWQWERIANKGKYKSIFPMPSFWREDAEKKHLVRHSNFSLIIATDLGYTIKTAGRIMSEYWWSVKMSLKLIFLTFRIWCAPNNASKCQMGFNSSFKALITTNYIPMIFPKRWICMVHGTNFLPLIGVNYKLIRISWTILNHKTKCCHWLNKPANVRITVTLRCVRATIVAVGKQKA